MFSKFIGLVQKIVDRFRFIDRFFERVYEEKQNEPNLFTHFVKNYLFLRREGGYIWKSIKFCLVQKKENVRFFSQNAEKVDTVANFLADEQSKKIYTGMIKFRQTHKREDFPIATLEEIEYFIDKLKFDKDEVFIDCGAYIGDTIDDFLIHCQEYKQIVAFEPEPKNFEKLKAKYGSYPKITLLNAGVYDREGVINFTGTEISGTVFTEGMAKANIISVEIKTIDNLNLEKVTFIKMDIEEAELNALKGAEKTIRRDKPKLAICIYHCNEDMIRIAEYIHNLIPEYKLYVRQHSLFPSVASTVIYAIP